MRSIDGDTSGKTNYLPGYDGELHLATLAWLLLKLTLTLYLIATALSKY